MTHALWRLFDSAIPVGVLLVYGGVPLLTLWGLVRWTREKKPGSVAAWFSYAGFALAAVSGLLAVGAVGSSITTGRLADATYSLADLARWGFGIAAAATLVALAGMARKNPLRWHATLCALGMLFLWSTSIFE